MTLLLMHRGKAACLTLPHTASHTLERTWVQECPLMIISCTEMPCVLMAPRLALLVMRLFLKATFHTLTSELPLSPTPACLKQRGLWCVNIVGSTSPIPVLSSCTSVSTRVRSRTTAHCVGNVSVKHPVWRNTTACTEERSPSAVCTVENCSQIRAIWRSMLMCTLGKNHTAVCSVAKPLISHPT